MCQPFAFNSSMADCLWVMYISLIRLVPKPIFIGLYHILFLLLKNFYATLSVVSALYNRHPVVWQKVSHNQKHSTLPAGVPEKVRLLGKRRAWCSGQSFIFKASGGVMPATYGTWYESGGWFFGRSRLSASLLWIQNYIWHSDLFYMTYFISSLQRKY